MPRDLEYAQKVVQAYQKKYPNNASKEQEHGLRLEIAKGVQTAVVNAFYSRKIQIQGKQSVLRTELEQFKEEIETNPEELLKNDAKSKKPTAQKYVILSDEIKANIKNSLEELEATVEIDDSSNPTVAYRAKIFDNANSLNITQYCNGTLFLQGKDDELFNKACDLIDTKANPSVEQVAVRFISDDETLVKAYTDLHSPELLLRAEMSVKAALDNAYNFLEPHDKKYAVSAECLRLSELALPEYTAVVMPASKAFEGFAKKLLIKLEMYDEEDFKSKSASLRSRLDDKTNSRRRVIVDLETYADNRLKKLSGCIDENRNFMMHSDANAITHVTTAEEAKRKLNKIFGEIKEFFDYFDKNLGLS